MFKNNRQLNANIEKIDVLIARIAGELMYETEPDEVEVRLQRIDELTKIRLKLVESKVTASYSKELVTGAISLVGMALVLKHEKAEIITSKAYTIATKMFRGV